MNDVSASIGTIGILIADSDLTPFIKEFRDIK